jgi:hypothetical protein
VQPIPLIDYAAFIDSRWHDLVLWVCNLLDAYTMTELWRLDIVKFTKLTAKAEGIQAAKMKGKAT